MNIVPRVDHVTGLLFLIGALVGIYRNWRAVVQRVGRHSTGRVNRRRILGGQLRYIDGQWVYP